MPIHEGAACRSCAQHGHCRDWSARVHTLSVYSVIIIIVMRRAHRIASSHPRAHRTSTDLSECGNHQPVRARARWCCSVRVRACVRSFGPVRTLRAVMRQRRRTRPCVCVCVSARTPLHSTLVEIVVKCACGSRLGARDAAHMIYVVLLTVVCVDVVRNVRGFPCAAKHATAMSLSFATQTHTRTQNTHAHTLVMRRYTRQR